VYKNTPFRYINPNGSRTVSNLTEHSKSPRHCSVKYHCDECRGAVLRGHIPSDKSNILYRKMRSKDLPDQLPTNFKSMRTKGIPKVVWAEFSALRQVVARSLSLMCTQNHFRLKCYEIKSLHFWPTAICYHTVSPKQIKILPTTCFPFPLKIWFISREILFVPDLGTVPFSVLNRQSRKGIKLPSSLKEETSRTKEPKY